MPSLGSINFNKKILKTETQLKEKKIEFKLNASRVNKNLN